MLREYFFYARDTGANALDKVHPGEHPKDERVPGAAPVAEVLGNIGEQASGVGDFQAVVIELHHNLGSVLEVVAVAKSIGEGFFDGVEGKLPDFLPRVEVVHDIFDGQILFNPGGGVVVLREDWSSELL